MLILYLVAFTSQLLQLGDHFEVHIVSSAPSHIFSDCLKASEHCHYRYAEIDPVVVQPLAYRCVHLTLTRLGAGSADMMHIVSTETRAYRCSNDSYVNETRRLPKSSNG